MRTIKVEIQDCILPSFNHFYSTKIHYTRRSQLVFKWKLIIGTALDKQLSKEDKVAITKGSMMKINITISQAKRRYDVDNCVMYGKIFLDCLKRYGVDDTPKIINTVSYTIDLENRINKALYEIIIP